MSTPCLHTEALTAGHGRCPVVTDVALELAPGELTALVGINGSGKSTLLRTLAGLQPPLQGRVLLGGRTMGELPPMERARQVAVVLTNRPQVGLLDVRTLVALGRQPWTGSFGRLRPADEQAVEEAMESAGVKELAARGIHALSDGERQKVMIARALAQTTPVMLLDEPTAFLDLVNRVQLIRLLRDIAHRMAKCVLLSTHDLRTALDMADRLVVVHQGRVWSGSPAQAVDEGVLAQAFQREGLTFDAATGTLR